MTTETYAPSAVGERIKDLCRQFRLPTLAAETVDRFSDAGHADALPTLVEVLEQEAALPQQKCYLTEAIASRGCYRNRGHCLTMGVTKIEEAADGWRHKSGDEDGSTRSHSQ